MVRIAVIGAGFLGACVSLELARRGYTVDLFDEHSEPITQAGFANEGKIHLGLVYANDPSKRTAEVMLKGALHFAPLLERWIDAPLDETWLSTRFYYGVHKDSLLDIETIRGHFNEVDNLYRTLKDKSDLSYLNVDSECVFQELTGEQSEHGFSPQHVPCLFHTVEKSVNTTKVAISLRQKLHQSGSIDFHPNTKINSIDRLREGKLALHFCSEHTHSAAYDHVVNAAWLGRLAIDQTVDLLPQRPWLYRFKCGVIVNANKEPGIVPTTTLLLGSFGDIVDYQDGSYYASWYPVGMIATSREVRPTGWPLQLDAEEQRKIKSQMLSELSAICPAASKLLQSDCTWELRGNTIFAWGKQDIDKLGSELHQRYDIGILSDRNYHSADPGKYTMAPYIANQLVDRIEGHTEEDV